MREGKTEMKIQAVLQQENLLLVSGHMVSGDVYDEIYLTCQETGGKWEMNARAFPSREDSESGFRLIVLEHVEGSKNLEKGFTLVSE
jgi:hypothetical protein